MQPIVMEWDANRIPEELRGLLPEQLRDLPAGVYVIEPVDEDGELTPEEEAGLELALDQLEAGDVISAEEVCRELR